MKNKKKKERDKNATFTKILTTLLQQILSNKLLKAVIDGKKIISMMSYIMDVALQKKKKKITTFFIIVELTNFY